MTKIKSIRALEVLDSRGNPTIEVVVTTTGGSFGKALVPSGASAGKREAVELRDNDPNRYGGKGVIKAVEHIHETIAPLLVGHSIFDQEKLDNLMIACDGTPLKSRLGGNGIVGVSLALIKAAAYAMKLPLYQYLGNQLGDKKGRLLPLPRMNVINGGVHADNGLQFQEFMICPLRAPTFKEALRWGVEIFHTLKRVLKKRGYRTSVGDEGGFSPDLESHEKTIELLLEAIDISGYRPGQDVSIALDCAASEYYHDEKYLALSVDDYIRYLKKLCQDYPIISIEDPLDQDDWNSWQLLTAQLPIQIVGDDIFTTNASSLKKGIKEKVANSILIKPNQAGTWTETLATINIAKKGSYPTILSHRSGETEDTTIADLAVATSSGNIKTGSLCRTDRVAKYNRLLEIEDELGEKAEFIPK